jgi:hypothetical protein
MSALLGGKKMHIQCGQTNINLTGIYCGLLPIYMYYGELEKNTKIIKNATLLLSGKNKNKFLRFNS